MNDLGHVVGTCEDANGVHGFLLRNGTFTLFDVPGTLATNAFGINNRGDIVGYSDEADGTRRGFLRRNGRLTTIGPPGSDTSGARGINVRGHIVGSYYGEDEAFHGFLYDPGND
jgi:probable HAF family extracellular repeat protein